MRNMTCLGVMVPLNGGNPALINPCFGTRVLTKESQIQTGPGLVKVRGLGARKTGSQIPLS